MQSDRHVSSQDSTHLDQVKEITTMLQLTSLEESDWISIFDVVNNKWPCETMLALEFKVLADP